MLEGGLIAFWRDKDVWLIDPATREVAQLTVSGNIRDVFGWSYDNEKLLIGVGERRVPESDDPGGTNLWTVNADGSDPRQLTTGLLVQFGTWSPVDYRIAYRSYTTMHFIDADWAGSRALVIEDLYLGAWSPDGAKIAFCQAIRDGFAVITVLDLTDDSTHVIARLEPGSVAYRCSLEGRWSLDGQRLFLRAVDDTNMDTWWLVDADGANLGRVQSVSLKDVVHVCVASQSPTADIIALAVYESSHTQTIWSLDFQGRAIRLAAGTEPTWSPDGERIAYIGEDGGLWAVKADGTGAEKLTDNARRPHWMGPSRAPEELAPGARRRQ